jgi:hypothetical protein
MRQGVVLACAGPVVPTQMLEGTHTARVEGGHDRGDGCGGGGDRRRGDGWILFAVGINVRCGWFEGSNAD